jgi:hypothetical protein
MMPTRAAPRIVSSAPGRTGLSLLAVLMTAVPASATDLLYLLRSPSFGGTDTGILETAQMSAALKAQRAAALAAAAKPAPVSDPNAPFVQAITSQLTGLVAQSVAQKIANSQNGQAGTIQSGNVVITYVNSDGQLSVTITSPTGSTTLSIPVGT